MTQIDRRTVVAVTGLPDLELQVVHARDSRRAVHAVLRDRLSERLGVEPEQLTFTREPCPACGGPHGRPSLRAPPPPLEFSIAHTDGAALLGIAAAPVGVDIERIPAADVALETAALLHPDEQREIGGGSPGPAFARIWTRKEAYLKALGTGIATDLAAVSMAGAITPPGWTVADLEIGPGYAAAVAIRSRSTKA